MELLTSFAINIAAGIAIDLYYSINADIKSNIDSAFKKTLKDWSKNTAIGNKNKTKLEIALKHYLQNPLKFSEQSNNHEIESFLDLFNSVITSTKYSPAYKFLSDIKNKQQHDSFISEFIKVNLKLDQLIENTQVDPRRIKRILDSLPLDSGIEKTNQIIENKYNDNSISLIEKETIKNTVGKIFEKTDYLMQEIEYLQKNNINEEIKTKVKLKNAILKKQNNGFTKIYDEYLNEERSRKERILQELILSAVITNSHDEAISLMQEYVNDKPFAENYIGFADYLKSIKHFDLALKEYQKAEKIYREQAQNKDEIILSNLATAIHKQAVIFQSKRIPKAAFKYFKEAIQIEIKLASKNQEKHLSSLGATYSNLGNLYIEFNDLSNALQCYEKSLEAYNRIPNPKTKEISKNIAFVTLNMGNIYDSKNKHEIAIKTSKEAFKMLELVVEDGTWEYMELRSKIQINIGDSYRKNNEFELALKCFEETIPIFSLVARQNKDHIPAYGQALHNWGLLYTDMNKIELAKEKYELALKVRTTLAEENPQIYSSALATTLFNLSLVYLHLGKDLMAKNTFNESMGIRFRMKDTDSHSRIDYAQSLIVSVDLYNNDLNNLNEAIGILSRIKKTNFTSDLSAFAKKLLLEKKRHANNGS